MNKIKYLFISIIVLLLLSFVYFVTYNFVEPKAYDYMVKHVLTEKLPFDNNKYTYGSDDIVLVVIDDETAEKYRWPWKRELWCKIFNYFNDYAHPKVVVHDAIFSTLDDEHPDSDKKFFNTLKRYDNLVEGFIANLVSWSDIEFGQEYDKKFADKFALKNVTNSDNFSQEIFLSLIPFPEPYFNSIDRVGFVTVIQGFMDTFFPDEIIRNIDYLIMYKGNWYPSLALQTFLTAYNNPAITISNNHIEFPSLNYKIKQLSTKNRHFIPLKFYKIPVINGYYYGYSHQKVSALTIMDSYDNIIKGKKPLINPELFNDKIILIGANVTASEGLVDIKHSPMMPNHPGVDIQAIAMDNLLHNDFVTVLPIWANILIMLLGMLFMYLTIRIHETSKAVILSVLTILLYILISAACFYNCVIIYVATPIVMFAVTMIIAYIHRFVIENRNKKKVENILGKYMSEDVMKKVIQNIDTLGLGGKKAFVTVLFSDIRGFTSMSEKMEAEGVTTLLNEYFSEMEPIVRKYNGIINKYIGDAVMAIFGEPINDKNHALNAVKCGYEMLQKVQELNHKWETEGKQKIEIGIGINTGEVFVGNIGSENRMEYTVIGDTVNLASRLESYNKTYETKILISSVTYEASEKFINARKISDVHIRGKAEPIDIYEVVSMIE